MANEIQMKGIEKNRVNNQTYAAAKLLVRRGARVVGVCFIYGLFFGAQRVGYLRAFIA